MKKQIFALLLTIVLAGCQTARSPITEMSRPFYAGAVVPIGQPVQLAAAPLNRKVGFSHDTTERTAGINPSSSRVQIEGTVESYQMGPDIQVRYALERMGTGGRLQAIPSLIVQATFDKEARIKTVEFGGPLLDHLDKNELAQVQQYLAAAVKFLYASTTVKPLMQGDIVQSIRISDLLRDTGIGFPEEAAFRGPGFTSRLVGHIVHGGRSAYLVSADGSETMVDGDSLMSISVTGYGIIDAATGLYSETNTLRKL